MLGIHSDKPTEISKLESGKDRMPEGNIRRRDRFVDVIINVLDGVSGLQMLLNAGNAMYVSTHVASKSTNLRITIVQQAVDAD